MGINTGTPGFDIDGKAYTYDVGDPQRPEDPNYPQPYSSGDINVDKNEPPTKDLSKTTKKTLASYLGRQTQVNYYKIGDAENTDYVTRGINVTGRNNETPRIPDPSETTLNTEWFTKGKKSISSTTVDSPTLRNWKTGKEFTPPDPSIVNLQKGKTTGASQESVGGNDLLSRIDLPDNNNPESLPQPKLGKIEPYTNAVLHNNRFSNSNRYVARSMESASADSESVASQTAYLDDISQDGKYNPTFYHPNYGELTAAQLAQVGRTLSLRASQELNASDGGNDPSSAGAKLTSTIPSLNQLAVDKIKLKLLEASDVLNSLAQVDEVPGDQFVKIADGSWGAINNIHDKFSGISSPGMAALSIGLSLAVSTAISVLGTLGFSDYFDDKNLERFDNEGKRSLGNSRLSSGFGKNEVFSFRFFSDFLGLSKTVYPYTTAVVEGIRVFYGADEKKAGSTLLEMGKNSVTAPGYFVSVSRAIVRSGYLLAEKITNYNKNNFSEFMQGTLNLLEILDIVRSSKIISAMNSFAIIGDASLSLTADALVLNEFAKLDKTKSYRESTIDLIENGEMKAAVQKNRLNLITDKSKTTLRTAWSNYRSPSLYLLPKNLSDEILNFKTFGAPNTGYSHSQGTGKDNIDSLNKYSTTRYVIENRARIRHGGTQDTTKVKPENPETLKEIEKRLDAAYVPFYFHDVRTNEVISFHAFLDSFQDGFQVDYEPVSGIGRIEPVKIYKGTTRSISMSFWVAALGSEDFDDMWVKINKLVTLVYPQYTEGKRVIDSGYNFIQPFSQMVASSPLIRIRLGNLLSSNYSRFALARLFGATLSGASFQENIGEQIKTLKNNKPQKRTVDTTVNTPSAEQIYKSLATKHYRALLDAKQDFIDSVKTENAPFFRTDRDSVGSFYSTLPPSDTDVKAVKANATDLLNAEAQYENAVRAVPSARGDDAWRAKYWLRQRSDWVDEARANAADTGRRLERRAEEAKKRESELIEAGADPVTVPAYVLNAEIGIDPQAGFPADQFQDERLVTADSVFEMTKADESKLMRKARAIAAAQQENARKQIEQQEAAAEADFNSQIAEWEARIAELETAAKNQSTGFNAVEEFFKPEKNSIVRSFRSAGGKGLAGVIESMNFEWLDNQYITWDIYKNAPKLCKVTLQFAPIHDISPGLDSQGYNRAPVYPVGHFAHSVEERDEGPED